MASDIEDEKNCEWCGRSYETDDLFITDYGILCERCVKAIKSRGESITVYGRYKGV